LCGSQEDNKIGIHKISINMNEILHRLNENRSEGDVPKTL